MTKRRRSARTKAPIAVIDVGSNAVRFIVARVKSRKSVEIVHKIRKPIRVGKDVFGRGSIGPMTIRNLERAFLEFRDIIEHYEITRWRAVATSAFREAKNGRRVAYRILRKTGIEIEIISGDEEASIIQEALVDLRPVKTRNVLLIDIGGGSVELTAMSKGKKLGVETLALGTVRMLNWLKKRRVSENDVPDFIKGKVRESEARICKLISKAKISLCVGTGGNFEDLLNVGRRYFATDGQKPELKYDDLCKISKVLAKIDYTERIREFQLRPDRADVILPASYVAKNIMKFCDSDTVLIPKRGLKDGLLLRLAAAR